MESTCTHCSSSFEITKSQFGILQKVSPVFNGKKCIIPPPILCPLCRQKRRTAFRNERSYYKRSCSQCNRAIISVYQQDTAFPVHCDNCYKDRTWDPLSYEQNYDLDRSFFAQFTRLQNIVPRLYFNSVGNENCEYSNHVATCKNCYLLVGSMQSEDCHYGYRVFHCRDCLDCMFVEHCELCYECINCEHCYNVRYGFNCYNVQESSHLEHCRGSKHLLYCVGITQGEYKILNQQFSKEEYLQRKQEIEESEMLQKQCERIYKDLCRESNTSTTIVRQSEQCTGNYIVESSNCSQVYDVHHMQDVQYAYDCGNITDSMDLYSVYGPGSLNYEVYSASIAVNNNLFIRDCWPAENLLYCDHCFGSKHCFGCIGLQKHKYCILNKQYTKEEYEVLVPQIIESMNAKREWGEFFPADSSPFPLEDTMASNTETDPNKLFKLIEQEKEFYKKMNLPVPKLHPNRRHELRLQRKNNPC